MYVHTFASIIMHNISSGGQNIGPRRTSPPRIYDTRLQQRNLEIEECARQDAHYQEELNALKDSVTPLSGLLEQALRNASVEGPSSRP